MSTTPTGIPIIDCDECGLRHPAGRRHCSVCNRPSLFFDRFDSTRRCPVCQKELT